METLSIAGGGPIMGVTRVTPMTESERDFLARCRAGDASAVDRVVREHLPALWRFSLGMTADRALAEDLVQETITRFILTLDTFEGRCRVSTWLYSILHSLFVSHRRRAGLEDEARQRWAGRDRDAVPAGDAVEPVLRVLRTLDDDLRVPCVLFYLERRSVDEIAEILSLPKTTVKWRLHQARESLRGQLREERP